MTVPGGPVLGRRRLAQALRSYRVSADRTIAEVADHLECSPAKVSRMETGAVKVRAQDLRAMTELYGIEETERELLYSLVRQSRQRAWWHAYTDVVPPESAILYGLEDGAVSIEQFAPSLVPGLLQTEGYARALIESAGGDGTQLERRVQLRLRRQELLLRPQPCELHVLLDESVVHGLIGGRDVMAEQLTRLLDVGALPHVSVQVLPFEAGAHPAAGVAFTLFDFSTRSAAPVVYTEQLSRNSYVDQADEIATYRSAWEKACELAAPPERSLEMVSLRLRAL